MITLMLLFKSHKASKKAPVSQPKSIFSFMKYKHIILGLTNNHDL